MAGLDSILVPTSSSDGLFTKVLKDREGSSLSTYSDSLGTPTIGVGFNLTRPDARERITAFGLDYDSVLSGRQNLTQGQSNQLAGETELEAVGIARSLVLNYDKLNRARQIALADMAHNIGQERLGGFTNMLAALNQETPDFDKAAAEVRDSLYFSQIGERARLNAEALMTGQLSGFNLGPGADKTYNLVSDGNPDEAATNRKVSKETGIPLALVEADPVQAQKVSTRAGLDQVLFPVTAKKMKNPEFAKIAHDDDSLQKVEAAATGLDAALNAFHRGGLRVAQVANQALGERAVQAMHDKKRSYGEILDDIQKADPGFTTGPDDLLVATVRYLRSRVNVNIREKAQSRFENVGELKKRIAELPMSDLATNMWKQVQAAPDLTGKIDVIVSNPLASIAFGMEVGAEFAPQLAVTAGATVVGGPVVGAATLGSLSFATERYVAPSEFLEKNGVDLSDPASIAGAMKNETLFDEAAKFGFTRGLIIGAMDAASFGFASRTIGGPMRTLVTNMIAQPAFGGGGEALAQLATTGKIDIDEVLAEALGELAFAPAEVVAAGGGKASKLTQSLKKKRALDRVVKAGKDSKLKQRAPDLDADAKRDILLSQGVKSVFIDISELVKYGQAQPEGVAVFLQNVGVDRAAVEKGGDVQIDTLTFIREIINTPAYDALANHIRLSEDEQSVAQAMGGVQEAAGAIEAEITQADVTATEKEQLLSVIEKFNSEEGFDINAILKETPTDIQAILGQLVAKVEARQADISDITAKGRVREIDARVADIDQEISTVSDQIEEREASVLFQPKPGEKAAGPEAGKSTTRLNQRLEKLEAQRQALETEEGKLGRPAPLAKPSVTKKILSVRGEVLEKLNLQTTKEAVKAVKLGFAEGLKVKGRSIKEIQSALIKVIEKSKVADKGKFLRTVKNIQTIEQLKKQLPKLRSRINTALTKQRKAELTSKLKKLLAKTAAKGKIAPKGRFDPETQVVLDLARKMMSKTAVEARTILLGDPETGLAGTLENEAPTALDQLANKFLAVAANHESMSVADLEDLVVDMTLVKEDGVNAGKQRLLAKLEKKRTTIDGAVEAVSTGEISPLNVDNVGIARRVVAATKSVKEKFNTTWLAWNDIRDIMFNKKGVDPALTANLEKTLDIHDSLQAVHQRAIQWEGRFQDMAIRAFGVENQKQVMDRHYKDAKKEDLGQFKDANGKTQRLQMSRAERRTVWAMMKDETIAESLTHEKGNAFTEDMIQAIVNGDNEVTALDQTDFNYVEAELQFLKNVYPEVNEVYKRMYGVDLPFNEFYFPIQRRRGLTTTDEAGATTGKDAILTGDIPYRAGLASQLKSRTPNLNPLLIRSDVGAMARYMHDMINFIETAEQARVLQGVFESPKLREEIKSAHGDAMLNQIDGFVKNYSRGYFERGGSLEQIINFFNRGFSRAQLGLKPTIGFKQVTSLVAMSENIPAADFVAGLADFAKKPKKHTKFLFNSLPLLAKRGSSLEFEIAKIGGSKEPIARFRREQRFDDFAMLAIRLGDRAPIYAGGWARYKFNRKQGMSHGEAIADVSKAISSTQQSTDVDQLSELQASHGFGRFLTMFMTARLSLLRAEGRAIRQGWRGKITPAEAGKRLFALHIAIPVMIQYIASGFRWEPDRQLVAMTLGQLNSFLLLGELTQDVALWAIDADRFEVKEEVPLVAVISDVQRGMLKALEDGATAEDQLEAVWALFTALGQFIGKPIEQIGNLVTGFFELPGDKHHEAILKLSGFSAGRAKKITEGKDGGRFKGRKAF